MATNLTRIGKAEQVIRLQSAAPPGDERAATEVAGIRDLELYRCAAATQACAITTPFARQKECETIAGSFGTKTENGLDAQPPDPGGRLEANVHLVKCVGRGALPACVLRVSASKRAFRCATLPRLLDGPS